MKRIAVALASMLASAIVSADDSPPDTIFSGRFITLDTAAPRAEAMAVRNGVIVAIGTRAQVERAAPPTARRVQVPGYSVPGLADAHIHPSDVGHQLEGLQLFQLSKQQVIQRVRVQAKSLAGGTWIRGDGWDQTLWPGGEFPTARELDAVSGDHPVFLYRIDGHAAWVNSRALALAGISRATADLPGGQILRDSDGTPSGIVTDDAKDAVVRALPVDGAQDIERQLRSAFREMLKVGLTSVHDADVQMPVIEVYRDMARRHALPLRVYVMVSMTEPTLTTALARGPEIGLDGGFLTIRSVKAYVDGALGSYGAELSAPYTDRADTRGTAITTDEQLDSVIRRAAARGFQVNTHAIGDSANHRVLDAYERAGPAARALRFRVEHASMLRDEDVPRFAKLGVIASIQPNFVGEYSRWGEARVGSERLPWMLRFRDLIDAGARIATGTDFPDESIDPITTLYCAVTRSGFDGAPAGGWRPDQRVSVDTALRGATAGAAYAAFQENELGALTVGRFADFTVLSGDPYLTSPNDLRSVRVLMTVVGGQIRYRPSAN